MSNDIDNDGQIDEREFNLMERKLRVQRRMAIVSFGANLIVAAVLIGTVLAGILTPAMAASLASLLPMFWVGSWGIIAAYMGVEGWMNKK